MVNVELKLMQSIINNILSDGKRNGSNFWYGVLIWPRSRFDQTRGLISGMRRGGREGGFCRVVGFLFLVNNSENKIKLNLTYLLDFYLLIPRFWGNILGTSVESV